MISYDISLTPVFLLYIYKKYSQIIHHSKKTMETRIIKNIFNKNGRRCRDVKTQKACEQGRWVNRGPKIKQTTSI